MNLSTPEPVKVDINVRLDVYQHADKKTDTDAVPVRLAPDTDVETRRRARMGEIQQLKNSRIVGENRLGLLDIRNLPPGEFGDYVKRLVEEENADRSQLFEKTATTQNVPIVKIQEKNAGLARDRAFNGEWIEIPVQTGGFTWVQKGN